jgi:hypothetical protein
MEGAMVSWSSNRWHRHLHLAARLRKLVPVGLVAVACTSLNAGVPSSAAALQTQLAPIPGQLNAVAAIAPDDVWAVGLTQSSTVLVEHYDGNTWQQVHAPSPGYVSRLAGVSASGARDVWAVGTRFLSGESQTYHPLVEHFDGTRWRVVAAPSFGVSSYLTAVTAVSPDDVWAVGWVERAGTGDRTLVEHWDGHSWNRVPSASPEQGTEHATAGYRVDVLYGVWAEASDDVWAVGAYYPLGNDQFESPLVEHWDGHHWRQVPSPLNPTGAVESYLYGVSGSPGSQILAVGGRYTDHWSGLIEHWDGSRWRAVRTAPDSDQLLAVASVGRPLAWAVGGATTEQMDRTGWHVVLNDNQGAAVLAGVTADEANDAWAVGGAPFGEDEYAVIDHWDGASWTELTTLP